MPRLPLHPSSGTGRITAFPKTIRFVRYGCANRPFYHLIVMATKHGQHKPPIEQLGTMDPLANKHNELVVGLNFERIQYWIAKGADVSKPVAKILGLAGFFPIHPKTYLEAWRNRRAACEKSDSDKVSVQNSGS